MRLLSRWKQDFDHNRDTFLLQKIYSRILNLLKALIINLRTTKSFDIILSNIFWKITKNYLGNWFFRNNIKTNVTNFFAILNIGRKTIQKKFIFLSTSYLIQHKMIARHDIFKNSLNTSYISHIILPLVSIAV